MKHFILFPMIGAAFLTVDCATFAQGTTLYVLTQNASHDRGYSYIVKQDFGTPPDTALAPMISKLRIFENGIELGPAHSLLADIRHLGKGRFRHWGKGQLGISKLYFSTSDNADPRTNGRIYTYQIDAELAPTPAPAPTPSTITGPVFYVAPTGNDSNPGTQAAPWRTIQKAADTLTAGQTAILMDGTYEQGEISFHNSGTASQRITLMAQHKWQAIVSSTSGCNPAISIYASYITIQDIRIRVSPHNVTCTSLTANIPAAIRAWEWVLPTPSNPNSTYAGFTARGVYIDYSPNMALGIKTSMDQSLVEDSEIHNSLEEMMSIGTVFRNNVLYQADVFGSTISSKGGSRNFQAYNNVVHLTMSSEGLLLGGASCAGCHFDPTSGVECYNCVAYNNVVINETGSGLAAFLMAGCQDCIFLNNVGINGGIGMRGGGSNLTTSPNPTWKNNILSCNGVGFTWTGGSGTVTVDYNDFYQCPGAPQQSHAIVGDPLFVNPASDWHLQPGSPALGSGVEVSMTGISIDVSRNKDGNIRTPAVNLGIY